MKKKRFDQQNFKRIKKTWGRKKIWTAGQLTKSKAGHYRMTGQRLNLKLKGMTSMRGVTVLCQLWSETAWRKCWQTEATAVCVRLPKISAHRPAAGTRSNDGNWVKTGNISSPCLLTLALIGEGGGAVETPLRFFEDSEKLGARRHRFLHTLSAISSATFLKKIVSRSSQVRSPGQVKWPYLPKSLWCYGNYNFRVINIKLSGS